MSRRPFSDRFSRFLADTSGSTALEYAMIGSLISILILIGVTGIGKAISTRFYNGITGALN